MNAFNEIVNINNEVLEISFTLIFTIKGRRFFVQIKKEGKNYICELQPQAGGAWIVAEPCLQWIKEMEATLSGIIVRNLAG